MKTYFIIMFWKTLKATEVEVQSKLQKAYLSRSNKTFIENIPVSFIFYEIFWRES